MITGWTKRLQINEISSDHLNLEKKDMLFDQQICLDFHIFGEQKKKGERMLSDHTIILILNNLF